jgi:hypothetical protein
MYAFVLDKHGMQITEYVPHRFAAAGNQGTRIKFRNTST